MPESNGSDDATSGSRLRRAKVPGSGGRSTSPTKPSVAPAKTDAFISGGVAAQSEADDGRPAQPAPLLCALRLDAPENSNDARERGVQRSQILDRGR